MKSQKHGSDRIRCHCLFLNYKNTITEEKNIHIHTRTYVRINVHIYTLEKKHNYTHTGTTLMVDKHFTMIVGAIEISSGLISNAIINKS